MKDSRDPIMTRGMKNFALMDSAHHRGDGTPVVCLTTLLIGEENILATEQAMHELLMTRSDLLRHVLLYFLEKEGYLK